MLNGCRQRRQKENKESDDVAEGEVHDGLVFPQILISYDGTNNRCYVAPELEEV